MGALRAVRGREPRGELVAVSACDPLNLAGHLAGTAGVAAVPGNRVLIRDGVPLAAREGGRIRALADWSPLSAREVEQALTRRRWSDGLTAHLRAAGATGRW